MMETAASNTCSTVGEAEEEADILILKHGMAVTC